MPVVRVPPALIYRRDASSIAASETTASVSTYLLITLVALLIVGLLLFVGILTLRRVRHNRCLAAAAPGMGCYERRTGRGLTIHTTNHEGRSNLVYSSAPRSPMLAHPSSPPASAENVPAIHITFPDETDAAGRRSSGRVVIVRMGDSTIGLEPVRHIERKRSILPPAYEDDASSYEFYSVDMKSIGGLVEKNSSESR